MDKYTKTIQFIKHKYKMNIGLYEDRSGVFAAQAIGALRAVFTMAEYDTELTGAEYIAVQRLINEAVKEVKA